MIFKKLKQSSLYIIASAFLFSSTILPASVFALDEQFYSGNDILFYKPDEQSITNNPCASLTTPQINDKVKLAAAINQYIQAYSDRSGQKSPFIGLGQSFVDGAINNGVNPFIGVLHSQKESGFATATNKNWFTYVFATEQAALSRDENQKVASYNSFGRSAGEGQPTAWYPSSGGPRMVYKWASWQDSLTGADSFFAYYKRKWIDESGYTTIGQVIKEYAPATDGNNPNEYASFMYENLSKLIELSGDSIACGGLVTGGMNLDQAKAFMNIYGSNPSESLRFGGTSVNNDCDGGPLYNCVTFSVYFINKYTSLKGFSTIGAGNGRDVVKNIRLRNIDVTVDNTPEIYAVFSRNSGEWGHTGIVLGIDTANNKLIIGEASCGAGPSGVNAVEKNLSEWTNNNDYTYAHISNYIKNL